MLDRRTVAVAENGVHDIVALPPDLGIVELWLFVRQVLVHPYALAVLKIFVERGLYRCGLIRVLGEENAVFVDVRAGERVNFLFVICRRILGGIVRL